MTDSPPAASRPAVSGTLREARWWREGYAAERVDSFLGELDRALRHDPPAMAPYEVADQRFPVSRRGRRYDLRAVDDHLDEVQAALKERHGGDAVAGVEGRGPDPHHVSTWWIYLLALVIAVAVVGLALSQF